MGARLALPLALILASGAATAEPLELEAVVGLILAHHPALESQRNAIAESRARVEIEGGRFEWNAFAGSPAKSISFFQTRISGV